MLQSDFASDASRLCTADTLRGDHRDSPSRMEVIMKSTALVCAIAAASLGFGSLSFAQGYERDGRHGSGSRGETGVQQHDSRQWQRGQYQQPQRGYQQQQRAQPRYESRGQQPLYGAQQWQRRQPGQYAPQYGSTQPQPQWRAGQGGQYAQHGGWNQAPRFRRGDVLPYEYRHYVNDWRAHRLYAPPYGYQWVQADTGDYLLIAVATGLIANLLLSQ
jgi:Ni/Co efflux regulator RcnB